MNKHPLTLAVSLALAAMGNPLAQAASFTTSTWSCADGNWADASCWNPSNVPTALNDTVVSPFRLTDTTLRLDKYSGKQQVNYLSIDSASFAKVSVVQSGSSLAVSNTVIGNTGAGNYIQSGGTNSVANTITLGNAVGSSGSYALSGMGILSAGQVYVGKGGTGNFTQSGGTHTAISLDIGKESGSTGTYNLSAGSLSVDQETIGSFGMGTFIQSGGTHNVVNDLKLAPDSIRPGFYTLKAGTLNVGGNIVGGTGPYGHDSLSFLNLDGGNLTVGGGNGKIYVSNLTLGSTVDSNGSHMLTGTGSIITRVELIGENGKGNLTQNGGNHIVTDQLVLGDKSGSMGSYTLNDGLILVDSTFDMKNGTLVRNYGVPGGTEYIGKYGSGIFTQNGGENQLAVLNIGFVTGSSGSYTLNAGRLWANKVVVGGGNAAIGFGGAGSFTHNGGRNLVANDLDITSEGSYTLRNSAELLVDRHVKGEGWLVVNGGTLSVLGDLSVGNLGLGFETGANVTYTMNGSGLYDGANKVANTFNVSTLSLGSSGTGNFTLIGAANTLESLVIDRGAYRIASGGILTINKSLANNDLLSMAGGTLNGGAALAQSASGLVTGYGMISVNTNSAGTINAKSGNLIFNGSRFTSSGVLKNSVGANLFIESSTVSNLGHIEVNSAGSVVFDAAITNASGKNVTLLGGTLATPILTNQAGGNVRGFGTFTGNLSNFGVVDFYGRTNIVGDVSNQAGATMLLRNDQTLITGHVVNDGTLRVINGSAVFEGGLVNNGAYLSDPSSNLFTNLEVTQLGYFVGGVDDNFFISGNFENYSLQNTLWNTNSASLFFNGVVMQNVYLAGGDMGAILGGFHNNFAWGELSLGKGAQLTLLDGNTTSGAALYVGLVELGDGLGQLANIYSDYNIYYDSTLAGNAWLGRKSYALNGSGYLMAASAVPVPAAVWLLGSGLLGLVGVARRKNFS